MKSFIYIEPSKEGIDSLTKQIALKISKIPVEVRGPLRGISIGNGLDGKESQLSGLFDELIRVEVPSGDELNTELISNILTDVLQESGPAMLFLGFTHLGMEVGPAVGWRLQIPTITSCIDFDWTGGDANVKRPIVGGKLLVSFSVKSERGMVISVQKGAWEDEVSCESVSDSVPVTRLPWRNSWAAEKTQWIGISEESLEGEEDITKAEILVSVGRGLGGPENLPIVKELAEKLGGIVSCSRPVVDLGWLPPSRQVGISGKSVSPVIYLALGISGQSNHLAGMDGSKIIIAVNKDPLAPIFNVANFGVVDDILEFVPGLLDQIKQKQGY
jgi:electron transfer flavoprotein alpha subunit